MNIVNLIDKLYRINNLEYEELLYILENLDRDSMEELIHKAHQTRLKTYGNRIYIRGLIEFSNYCKRGCIYCGINVTNKKIDRYRLDLEDILLCCEQGYELGYKTFVLQSGEDDYYSGSMIEEIIVEIKNRYEDIAITLSIGEKSYESYERYYKAGADRYLLRHETANRELFQRIHMNSNYENRIDCLWNIKKIGYQVGAGFMVGLPFQTKEDLVEDLLFLKKLEPEMVGIGPFIPHRDTIYKDKLGGTVEDTIIMISLVRLLLPHSLLPATTALETIDPDGRNKGIRAGANVIMLNLSPAGVREKYSLYNGKVNIGNEIMENRNHMGKKVMASGFTIDMSKGDHMDWRC